MKETTFQNGFRVIIAGGGLAGLTLANALERAGIDYLLLEARAVIDPAVGASMGIMPNGSRILDQLGCYDDIADLTYGIKMAGNHRESGELIFSRDDSPQLGLRRTGYDAVFLDRQLVLRVLYKHIKDKSKIMTKKRISSINHTAQDVVVLCEDGTSHRCDIIAGADGVFSTVRQKMWKVAALEEPAFFSEEEKEGMTAEYQVLYGISTATSGLEAGNYDVTYMKDVSSMVIIGKDNVVYWFIFKRLDRVYRVGEIPKYTKADAEEFAEHHSDINLERDPKVTFGDIWKNRKYYTLVATEEADHKLWTWGRFVCLGDSVHKVTPNAGVGGNASFESAAALANSIKALVDSTTTAPSFEAVKQHLKQYEKSRWQRTSDIMKVANSVTRLQALKGLTERIIVFFVIPNAGDTLSDLNSDMLIGATRIDYLPPPDRSLKGTMPFNPEQGIGKKESIVYRILLALPFLVISAISFNRMDAGLGLSDVGEMIVAGKITWDGNSFALPTVFYHVEWLDNLLRPLTIFFASSNFGIDPVAWWQMLSFITDLGVLYSIFLIESTRRSNVLTLAQFPVLFGWAAQILGIGVISPLYFFLHYMSAQIENFKALDQRLTNLAYTHTVLPVMIIGFYIPHYISYIYPNLSVRHAAGWIWQLYPVLVSGIQILLAKTIVPDTIRDDRIHAPTRDLSTIHLTVGFCITLAGAVWLYTLIMSPFSPIRIFVPHFNNPQSSWTSCARGVLQYDYIFCWGSALLWLGYLFADLKHAGMVAQSWTTIFAAVTLSVVSLGPGATVGLVWLWREDVLATKRHSGAIIKGWDMSSESARKDKNSAVEGPTRVSGQAMG